MIGTVFEGRLTGWLSPFEPLFTRPTWRRVLVLIEGVILTPHRRTVSTALRAAGKSDVADFARYHAVLNRCGWSALAAAQIVRWLPDRRIVMVVDSGFSAIDLLAAVSTRVCMVTRGAAAVASGA